MRVAGIAGGVGTTVVATVLGATDAGLELAGVDVIVARNDYRCARALVRPGIGAEVLIVLIVEKGRALTTEDFRAIVPNRIVPILADPAVARADDAGLLDRRHGPTGRFADRLARAIHVHA